MATQVLSFDSSTVLEPWICITLYIYNVRTIMSSVHQGGLAHNKYVPLEAGANLLHISFQHSMTPRHHVSPWKNDEPLK